MILVRKNTPLLLGHLAGASKNSILLSPSSFASKADDPSPKAPFIVKYLIESVGLSSPEAIKCSKFLTHIKSPSKPDSVLQFFRKNGFTDAGIKRIICSHSRVLYAKVDSTLKPKFQALRDIGFSETQITKLITARPPTLKYLRFRNVRPRIEFLNTFLVSKDDILNAISKDICLLSSSLEKTIKPNISFLRECQFSNEMIGSMLISNRRFIGRPLNSIKSIAKKIEELGVTRESEIFYYVFRTLCRLDSDIVDAKMKLLSSLGFSESELVYAILKQPLIVCLSAKNLREKVEFLVKNVGCKLSDVSRNPSMLGLSLSKRLIPRNCVMKLIMEKGLLKKKIGFCTFATLSERKFLEKFIFSFQKRMPELPDVYFPASEGKFLY